MNSQELYKKETGLEAYDTLAFNDTATNEYMDWLEKTVEQRYEPTIIKWIKEMFEHAEKKQWFETYFAIDLHGTVSQPDYRKDSKEIIFYPYAKETLQLLTKREDIILIMFSSSYPEEIEIYKKQLLDESIVFNYINKNPEVSDSKGSFGYYEDKLYFNVLMDDKAGFEPHTDWKFLYDYFINTEYKPNPKWSKKYKEDYHK